MISQLRAENGPQELNKESTMEKSERRQYIRQTNGQIDVSQSYAVCFEELRICHQKKILIFPAFTLGTASPLSANCERIGPSKRNQEFVAFTLAGTSKG
jgi:hypothetical protein